MLEETTEIGRFQRDSEILRERIRAQKAGHSSSPIRDYKDSDYDDRLRQQLRSTSGSSRNNIDVSYDGNLRRAGTNPNVPLLSSSAADQILHEMRSMKQRVASLEDLLIHREKKESELLMTVKHMELREQELRATVNDLKRLLESSLNQQQNLFIELKKSIEENNISNSRQRNDPYLDDRIRNRSYLDSINYKDDLRDDSLLNRRSNPSFSTRRDSIDDINAKDYDITNLIKSLEPRN